jgi:hypothetical protein
MKLNGKSLLDRTRRRLARGVAFVLLTGIVYSVSFGTVHKHGESRPSESSAISDISATASSFTIPVSSGTQTEECLICVLHRQLSFSTVEAPHFVVHICDEAAIISAAPVFYHSIPATSSPIARLSGRAPPSFLA